MADALVPFVELVRALSTKYFFVLVLRHWVVYFLAMVFSLDLIVILLTVLLRRYLSHHLTIRPMAHQLGFKLPYAKRQRAEVYRVFLQGLEPVKHPSKASA